MPKTRVQCPNCQQPVITEITQLFDVSEDPSAKQRLLSGAANLIQCTNCGYQGNLATPLVYHDAEKELLLTFVPPELGLRRDEQERLIGGMINQVFTHLPQEKRKGYLFNPQTTLTFQGLIERILEADGITREMIQGQQDRINLIRRLVSVNDASVLEEIARQEDKLIDEDFFGLLRRFVETAMMTNDKQSAQALSDLQRSLLPITTYGKVLQQQSLEVQTAIQDLQALGNDITREKLLDLINQAPNEIRLSVLVSLTRQAMDYSFFQLLSSRIDQARGEELDRLVELRTKLLEITQEMDRQMAQRVAQVRQGLEQIINASDTEEAVVQNLPLIDDLFMQEAEAMLADARAQGDLEKSARINKILETVEQLNSMPGAALVEEFLDAPDDAARQAFLENNKDQIDQEFMDMLAGLVSQVQSAEDPDLIEKVNAANRQAIRFMMRKNLRGD
ncbi:MAG TPA: CpXC domain-containing protein [Anaerolineales bacterium]|nr:CpXC domain-containing protein [Anaerolineales bacterium]